MAERDLLEEANYLSGSGDYLAFTSKVMNGCQTRPFPS